MRKNIFKSAIFAIIIITALILLCFLVMKGNLMFGKSNVDKIEKSKENVIGMAKENKVILDTLAERIYLKDAYISIKYEDEKIQFEENGKEKEIDQKLERDLASVFISLNCESITLKEETYGKIIKILLGVNEYKIGNDLLIYCEDKYQYLENEFFPDWYYQMLPYE